MDDIVKQAMLTWPNVPNCFGWLGLDARGHWYMRDDHAQHAGSFASGLPGAKGSLLQHRKLIEFIGRNYAGDDRGLWYFQNGPQRVYVELEATPWIWRISDDFRICSQDDRPADYLEAFVDEKGWFYLKTSLGFGLVHSQDVRIAADAIEQLGWIPSNVSRAELPGRFKFVTSPAILQTERTSIT
jgi:hypothetical protein